MGLFWEIFGQEKQNAIIKEILRHKQQQIVFILVFTPDFIFYLVIAKSN